ncbi:GntR family transcriptional regulator [Mesorhizobium sp. SP-1A]|uniref:GntR family transcriptional regulator n=1 Tax=Mesorhizobium sp. SP-1A TaxID=3077840 RepID=UPI0028F70D25|nr:GntR family transcriptional regulator [Mesorhizobium sp. SP-1A]
MTRDSNVSAAERCYRALSRKIVSLELKPNESIGEQALAGMLGVSRTPVREALSRLSDERLVDLRARAGVIVAPIRVDAVQTAQFVREKLEMAIVSEAAGHPNRRIMLGVRQAIEEQDLAIQENSPELFFEADERMHTMFCAMAGRESVWAIISDAKKHMDRMRMLSIQGGHLDILVEDHRRIADAVGAGDGSTAAQIMQTHLRRVIHDLTEIRGRFPQYFEPQ